MAISPAPPESKGTDVSNEEPDSEDLKRFRQEWLQELHKRNSVIAMRALDSDAAGTSAICPSHLENLPNVTERNLVANFNKSDGPWNMTDHPLVRNGEIRGQDDMPPSLKKALDIYRRAVSHEQTGELDEALVLYRQSFRLDDKVDRAYHRILMLESIAKQHGDIKGYVEDSSESLQRPVFVKSPKNTPILKENLAKIIRTFPTNLKFEPMNEDEPVLLNKLPEELLVLIISNLDPTSVERFAALSRKARLVSLDAGIWRVLVLATYRPPQIHDHNMLLAILESLLFDYRRVFIEQPRVRLDGVYIAICHYVRAGLSENYWVNVSHLITYHRYLRFFPNGQVLSLLANEEKNPQEIIPLLKPNLRMKGLFLGQWKLVGSTVHLSHLVDASARFVFPVIEATQSDVNHLSSDNRGLSKGPNTNSPSIIHRRTQGNNPSVQTDTARYTFEMTLNLRSKPLGRWNRMDIQTYDSVNLESGDVHPVALKHERPFWFSKVRSYR